jgi:hypothetical protein
MPYRGTAGGYGLFGTGCGDIGGKFYAVVDSGIHGLGSASLPSPAGGCHRHGFCIPTRVFALTPSIQDRSRMREIRPYGSVRGVSGDWHPYRDPSTEPRGSGSAPAPSRTRAPAHSAHLSDLIGTRTRLGSFRQRSHAGLARHPPPASRVPRPFSAPLRFHRHPPRIGFVSSTEPRRPGSASAVPRPRAPAHSARLSRFYRHPPLPAHFLAFPFHRLTRNLGSFRNDVAPAPPGNLPSPLAR